MALFGDWSRGNIFDDNGPFGRVRDNKGVHADVRNGVVRGTFWKGRDGNVYVAGKNGVNNAGRWDDNTANYWKNQAYKEQADPNRGGMTPNNDTGDAPESVVGPGGGGFNPFAAQEARNKADAIAKYDDEIAQANSAINRLGGQEAVGIANAGKAKDRAWQENENSFNESTGRYNMNTKDAIDNIKKTRDQIESDTATKVRSAKGILAAGGAGDSSFAKTVAPYEIAKAASKQQGEAQDAYAKNRRDMDVNYFAVKNAYNKNKDDIQSEYDNRVNSVKQKIAQSRAELLDRVRSANVGKQTANGSSMAAAIASQQGTRDQINRLGTEIDELGRDRSIPIQKVDWKAPDLATYDPKDVTVKDNSEIGGVNDEISPNLRPILSDEEKKKKQQLM
jgi:hypothetical protein|nr:MAG TPA: hypothetical protein [Caudoviricetes sp.]DAN15375.1 MAG TPA: hypothetical protein [Bacteriophage sp.]